MRATPSSSIPTWRYLLELVRYKPWLYLANGLLASGLFYFFLLVPGLIIRQIFDSLTGKVPASFNVWTLLGTTWCTGITCLIWRSDRPF